MDQADLELELDRHRRDGCWVETGTLGNESVTVVIPPYAQKRMKERDIDRMEVLEALALPRSSHGKGKTARRHEVAGRVLRGNLRVVYEHPEPELVFVITTHMESD